MLLGLFGLIHDFFCSMKSISISLAEGAQISQHDRAKTQVDGGSFKYFKSTFQPATTQLTVEVEDIAGRSSYHSLVLQQCNGR